MYNDSYNFHVYNSKLITTYLECKKNLYSILL